MLVIPAHSRAEAGGLRKLNLPELQGKTLSQKEREIYTRCYITVILALRRLRQEDYQFWLLGVHSQR